MYTYKHVYIYIYIYIYTHTAARLRPVLFLLLSRACSADHALVDRLHFCPRAIPSAVNMIS